MSNEIVEALKLTKPLKPSVCLAMIVKDEDHVIIRCLNSVKDVFTEIIIHDTGSTDDTMKVVSKWIKENGKHGYIERVPWVNFGVNRTMVLDKAQYCAEYTLMLDADEELVGDIELSIDDPHDTYQMTVKLGSTSYRRNFLFNNRNLWRYEGVVHEFPVCEDKNFTTGYIEEQTAYILSHHDGARSDDPDKYLKDADLLCEKLDSNKEHLPRDVFYYAQSLRDAGKREQARTAYHYRANMGGWFQERAYSWYQLGKLTNKPEYYLRSHEADPRRAEPLLALGKHYMDKQMWHVARIYLGEAFSFALSPEDDMLFREDDVYKWRCTMELAVCEHYCGEYPSAAHLNEFLLDRNDLPQHVRAQTETNLRYAQEALKKHGDT
jgi:glycosyltransferase involved in cell wall biosynthesis